MERNVGYSTHVQRTARKLKNMKTLAVLSRKGGTGKTTLAIHLAVAAERAGHTTILIDWTRKPPRRNGTTIAMAIHRSS